MALNRLSPTYRFGDFVLDAAAFRLTRAGEAVRLEPKAFDVLLCLLEHRGQVISRQELVAEAWKGISITDNAVSRVVANLRHALGDDPGQPRFIETVPTRGYCFIAQVVVEEGAARASEGEPQLGEHARRPAHPILRLAGAVAGVAVLVVVVVLAIPALRSGREGTGATTPVRTLAVLPLRNLTGDPSQDYFADGMTQALSDRFSELGVLGVVSTTSSARFRRTDLPVTRIASELGAHMLVEGAVARSGDRVRVSVSLVDGASGRRTWSARYDRPITDVLQLYDEIATSAAGEAKVVVDAVNSARRARRPVDPEAYDAYLRGIAALGNRWMAGGCRDAERLLLDVVARDPGFAPAHAALAWCYAYPSRLGRPVSEVATRAKAAAAAAIALDDHLALAHAVLGTIRWRIDYDWAGAAVELRRALELDPSSGLVLLPSAELHIVRGELEEGLPLLDRAIRLDPLSPDRNIQVGYSLLMAGRYHAAIERFERARVLDPGFLTARLWLAEAFAYVGDRDRCVSEYLSWMDGSLHPGVAPAVRRRLQGAYAVGGWSAFWREELALATEENARPGTLWAAPAQGRFTEPFYMARRHARLDDWNAALDKLEAAYEGRSHMMFSLPVDPLFVPLRANARFRSLLERTGAADLLR